MFGYTGMSGSAVFSFLLIFIFLAYPVKAQGSGRISLFIDPSCMSCEAALENIAGFKKRHPSWETIIHVMSDLEGFLDFSRRYAYLLDRGLEYHLDMKGLRADAYGITMSPSYIIEKAGVLSKVQGYVDLFRFDLDRLPV